MMSDDDPQANAVSVDPNRDGGDRDGGADPSSNGEAGVVGDAAVVPERRNRRWHRLSLREYLGLTTLVMLTIALFATTRRLKEARDELKLLRSEYGYLKPTESGQIAAARASSDQPLTYRVRVRVPDSPTPFRVAYSSVLPRKSASPLWYGAVPVQPGESLITVRILEDPRDHRWKISTLVGSADGTKRMATALPEEHAQIFRGSHQVISTGVGRETVAVGASASIRVLDERWLVGEGSLLLYGDRPPERDQIGVYAELQPDVGPL